MPQRRTSRHLPAPKGSRRAAHPAKKVKVVVAGDNDKVVVVTNGGSHRAMAWGGLTFITLLGVIGFLLVLLSHHP
jgi:hypothetical protein